MADAFAATGARVWVADMDADALAGCPSDWKTTKVDVSDEAAMAAMFTQIATDWGGLDVLCANAGIAGPTALIENVNLADWQACLAVNLDGTFLAAKYAVPMMKAQRSGAIVMTSSTAGQYGYPNRAPYAAAKWGVIGLAKTLAMELGPFGIRVNTICPGAVEGPRMEGVLEREAAAKGMSRDAVYEGYASGTSMGRFVEASDVAEMAVFLASDGARLVSGQVIAVDGHTVNPDPKI
jgi:NAD(P)-dependent dehydrogenase (short-subunit alcohol dehydrogenase family)